MMNPSKELQWGMLVAAFLILTIGCYHSILHFMWPAIGVLLWVSTMGWLIDGGGIEKIKKLWVKFVSSPNTEMNENELKNQK